MMSSPQPIRPRILPCIGLGALLILPFAASLKALQEAWLENAEFSYGVLIPFLVAYLVWNRRDSLRRSCGPGHSSGLVIVFVGCTLEVLSSLSGSLLLAGTALVVTILGTIVFLLGPSTAEMAAGPVALLILMIPLPSYVTGELAWRLQGWASTLSSGILRFLGTPVLQEGTLLKLPNYILEVKQACSGSRSLFALIALAFVLGLHESCRWWTRAMLVAVAPLLAVGTNIVRIVGTGLMARQWGALAADESLHMVWGILVFVIAILGLIAFQRFLRWVTKEYA